MTEPLIQRTFISGELSPELGGRADLARYLSSVALAQNFIILQSGAAQKRSGFRYVATAKYPDEAPRLQPFIFEAADQTYVLEFGHLYIRFFWHGAPVISGALPYEVATPYIHGDNHRLRIAQSADTLFITHPSYPPQQLTRLGQTNWVLAPVDVEPKVSAPTSVGASPNAGGTLNMRYVVTAVQAGTYEESYASAVATAPLGAVPTPQFPNTITWVPVAGAIEYNVYCDPQNSGLFGLIGRSTFVYAGGTSAAFEDTGIVPDFSITPPQPPLNPSAPGALGTLLFTGTDNYPSVCEIFQQRLWFANTNANREMVWGSRIGVYLNFARSTPLQDDDPVSFILAGRTISPVAHLVGLKNLNVLSDTGTFRLRGDETGAITPSTLAPNQEGYIGIDPGVVPCFLGDAILYVQARGTGVRLTRFDLNSGGLLGAEDLTVFARHLFGSYHLLDLAFQLQPYSVAWAVRDDGILLGCTFVPEQEVLAWHRHVSGGRGEPGCADNHYFKGLCVVPDTAVGEDRLYSVCRRTIGATDVHFIELLDPQFHPERTPIEDGFFVDSGLSYSGAPATVMTGLAHLNGMVVAVAADGAAIYDGDPLGANAGSYTVSGGAITLPGPASTVHVGLRIPAEIETLDLDGPSLKIRGMRKSTPSLDLLVYGTDGEGLFIGPDRQHLIGWRREPWQYSQTWWSGLLSMNLTARYGESGRLVMQHRNPLPCTLVGLIPNVEVGG